MLDKLDTLDKLLEKMGEADDGERGWGNPWPVDVTREEQGALRDVIRFLRDYASLRSLPS